MKKFIAGIVMTGLMFMALATGALAGTYGAGRNAWKSTDTSQSKYWKGNSVCDWAAEQGWVADC